MHHGPTAYHTKLRLKKPAFARVWLKRGLHTLQLLLNFNYSSILLVTVRTVVIAPGATSFPPTAAAASQRRQPLRECTRRSCTRVAYYNLKDPRPAARPAALHLSLQARQVNIESMLTSRYNLYR